MRKRWVASVVMLLTVFGMQAEEPGVQMVRFVQDDAQDYMVSKIYVLKHTLAFDIIPFLSGVVKRYNMNSVVSSFNYTPKDAPAQQILNVTCPVGMMPYVDDFIAKIDRAIAVDGKIPDEIIRGTGITRMVYRPQYRSGQILVDIIINAFIGSGSYSSLYAYDQNSNQIYWKDNLSYSEYSYEFLQFLDRPAPQINMVFTIYEVRESMLRDLGIEYLAWKNGPGLNMFQAAFDAFGITSGGTAAIQAASGPLGGFFFAPQFDASFIRVLAQSGRADITNTASLTVSNSDSQSYEIYFNPQLQNIIKSNNDQTSVVLSDVSQQQNVYQAYLKVIQPIVCLHSEGPEFKESIPNYKPGQYANQDGVIYFGYGVQSANVVERNNYGTELIETSNIEGNTSMVLNRERILAAWDKNAEIEQTIGVPFLCEIPILKYLFSTTTTSTETTRVYLTVTAEMLNTGIPSERAGELMRLQ